MKQKNLKKNFVYNITYQILKLILPLVTVPYVSRVLKTDGVGIYSYTYSIVYYFMIFAMLGLNNYGNRSIAKVRDNREELSKTFKEIHLFQILTTLLMTAIYGIFLFIYNDNYLKIFYIQFLYLFSCFFDINWFFFGLEEFKLTVTRNLIIKTISLIAIFLFIKTSNDTWLYTLILSGSTLLSHILLWPFVHKYVDRNVKIKVKDCFKHFKPCLKLFIPVIAVTIYKIMDKTMLGVMASVQEVGLYENSEKLLNVPIAIICALGTVMLPRMTNLFSKGDSQGSGKMIQKSMTAIMFLAFPMAFGIFAISKYFSILFFGIEFAKSGYLIMLLSVTIIFLAWGNVIRTQYLIPKEMDKEYIVSAVLGAVVNVIMNLLFIPIFKSIGACLGTIMAEFVVMFYQTIKVKNCLPIKEYLTNSIPFFVKSMIMLIVIYPFNFISMNNMLRLFLQVLIGFTIYILLNLRYIRTIIDFNKIKKNIFMVHKTD